MSADPGARAAASSRLQPAARNAAALVLGAAFMLLAGTSIANVAVPSIQRDLGAVPANRGSRLRLDYLGSLIVVMLLLALLVPLTIGRDHGWPFWGWVLLPCALVLLAAFLWLKAALKRQGNSPLLRPGLWADPIFRLGLALYLVYFSGVIPFFLYYSITLQYGLNYNALLTATVLAPYGLASAITSLRSVRIVARLTAPRTILLGCVISAVGNAFMILTMAADSSGRYFGLLMTRSMFFTGIGLGLVMGPVLSFVLLGVRSDDSGAVSGLLSTAQQTGSCLGVAVIGLAFFRGFQSSLISPRYPGLRMNMMLGLVVVVAAFVIASLLAGMITRRSRPVGASRRAGAVASAG